MNKKSIFFSLKIGFTICALVYIFKTIPLVDIGNALKNAHPILYAAGFLILVGMRYAASFRMRLLTAAQQIRISTWSLFEITLVSNFYVQFLPGNLAGGAIRWYRMNKIDAKPVESLAAIAYDRLIDTVSVVFLGVIFWFMPQEHKTHEHVGIVLSALLAGLVAIYAAAFSKLPAALICSVLHKFTWIPSWIKEKIIQSVTALDRFQAVPFLQHFQILVISILKDLIGIVVLVLFCQSLDISISFATLGWLRAVMLGIGLLPFAFSGLGVREGSLIVLMQPYGIGPADAVAFSFLFFIGNIILAILGGMIEAKTTVQNSLVSMSLQPSKGVSE